MRFAAFLLLLCTVPAVADAPAGASYLLDRERGWHWYEIDPGPEAAEPPVDPMPAIAAFPQAPPLSARWLRENLETIRDAAIDHPTPDNVRYYQYVQRYAMDKSSRFARVYEQVAANEPLLSEELRVPRSVYGKNAAEAAAGRAAAQLLKRIARDTGIFFFFRSDCGYCERQAPLLKNLQARHGMEVVGVSLDDRPIHGFPRFLSDQGQAVQLGIEATPALYLYNAAAAKAGQGGSPGPNGVALPPGFAYIGQGLMTVADIESRLIEAAHAGGWIDEADYRSAQVMNDVLMPLNAEAGVTRPMLDDPRAMVEYMRARLREGLDKAPGSALQRAK